MKRAWGIFILLLAPSSAAAVSSARTVLVFPFENQSSRSDLNWIAEGFAEILSSRLTEPSCYVLGRVERNRAYEELGIPVGKPLTLASEYKVAETLGVDWAVLGSFRVDGDRLTTRAQLLDVRGLKLAPPLEDTGELADLVDLTTRLAWRLLAMHDPGFTTVEEEAFRRRFPNIRLDAFENYMRGVLTTDDESRARFWRESDRLNPADHRAAFALGRLYFDQKVYASSAEWVRKLDNSDKNYLESLFLLGIDEFFLGHLEAAEKAFATLAKQIPLNEVTNNLGVMKANRGRFLEALASFQQAYQGDSTDPDFCFNLGVCLWNLKRYDEAAQYLEEALRQGNEDPEVHTFLAVAFKKLGNTAGEERELDWLADHEAAAEQQGDLTSEFVPHLRLKKNYDGRAFRLLSLAVTHALEERLTSQPAAQHSEVHLTRGKSLLAENRLAEAEREITEAVSLAPGDSEAHLVLGQVYKAQGRDREAVAELETSLHLKATPAAHLWLARIYLSLGQPEAAREHGQAALNLDPHNREAESWIEAAKAAIRSRASKKAP